MVECEWLNDDDVVVNINFRNSHINNKCIPKSKVETAYDNVINIIIKKPMHLDNKRKLHRKIYQNDFEEIKTVFDKLLE